MRHEESDGPQIHPIPLKKSTVDCAIQPASDVRGVFWCAADSMMGNCLRIKNCGNIGFWQCGLAELGPPKRCVPRGMQCGVLRQDIRNGVIDWSSRVVLRSALVSKPTNLKRSWNATQTWARGQPWQRASEARIRQRAFLFSTVGHGRPIRKGATSHGAGRGSIPGKRVARRRAPCASRCRRRRRSHLRDPLPGRPERSGHRSVSGPRKTAGGPGTVGPRGGRRSRALQVFWRSHPAGRESERGGRSHLSDRQAVHARWLPEYGAEYFPILASLGYFKTTAARFWEGRSRPKRTAVMNGRRHPSSAWKWGGPVSAALPCPWRPFSRPTVICGRRPSALPWSGRRPGRAACSRG